MLIATAMIHVGYAGRIALAEFHLDESGHVWTHSDGCRHYTFATDKTFRDHNDANCNGLCHLASNMVAGTLRPVAELVPSH